jgi:hypothetical protein
MSCYDLGHRFDCFSIISMTKGGGRPGAGRPKGSTTRPQLRDFFTSAEIKQLAEELKTDGTILKFLGGLVFDKAPQPLTDPDGAPLAVAGFVFVKNKNHNAGDPANT